MVCSWLQDCLGKIVDEKKCVVVNGRITSRWPMAYHDSQPRGTNGGKSKGMGLGEAGRSLSLSLSNGRPTGYHDWPAFGRATAPGINFLCHRRGWEASTVLMAEKRTGCCGRYSGSTSSSFTLEVGSIVRKQGKPSLS